VQVTQLTPAVIDHASRFVPGLGGILSSVGSMLGSVLPDEVKQRALRLVQQAIDRAVHAYNSMVDRAIAQVHALKDQGLQRLHATIQRGIDKANEEIAWFRNAVREGGEAERILQGVYAHFQQLANRAIRAFTAWDGQIHPDFGAAARWFRAAAKASKDATTQKYKNEWKDFIQTVAAPYVPAWKKRHAQDVEDAETPMVSPQEVAAVERAAEAVQQRVAAWDPVDAEQVRRRWILQQQIARVRSLAAPLAGQRSKTAQRTLWAMEEGLVSLEQLAIQEIAARPPVVTAPVMDTDRESVL
jgi:hypothetical protein